MLTGSCMCGGVRYEIDGRIGPPGHCHCATCRKAQGGAFVTNAPVRARYFRVVTGEDLVAGFESSPGKVRSFCRRCGSPLWSRRSDDPETVRIRLGLLDDDPGRRPLGHVWVGEKAPWFEITDDLPRWERGLDEPATPRGSGT
ncbi:MAG TPA: GFA family protein [Candidatus Eisenbacteria bacterium]|nr:GFA family protein [Candidatus Eisenbacteria bacterium]